MTTTNINQLSLYLVTEGRVQRADEDTECDGINSILVAATTEDSALVVADAYCDGLTDFDNMQSGGSTVSVVRLLDTSTGLFV